MTCTIRHRGPLPLATPAGEVAAAPAALAGKHRGPLLLAAPAGEAAAAPAALAGDAPLGPLAAAAAAVGLEGGVTKAPGAPCGVAGADGVASEEREGLPSPSTTRRPALRCRMPLVNSLLNSDFFSPPGFCAAPPPPARPMAAQSRSPADQDSHRYRHCKRASASHSGIA